MIATARDSKRPYDYLFRDYDGGLWMTNAREGLVMRVGEGVAALATIEGTPHIVRREGIDVEESGLAAEWRIERFEGDTPRPVARHGRSGTRAFLGTPAHHSPCKGLLLALEDPGGRWLVVAAGGLFVNTCPTGAGVIGVTALPRSSQPSLVYAEERSIFLTRRITQIETVVETKEPIVAAVMDPTGPRVAYVAGGRLVVRALDRGVDIHRSGAGE
jgi:hypothetical protein